MSNEKIAQSIASMVTEWVEGGIRGGTDWRNGLSSIIQKRLDRQRDTAGEIASAIDPETTPDGGWRDALLGVIHADIENRGRKDPDFAVTVHHRNIVLSATAAALRNKAGA